MPCKGRNKAIEEGLARFLNLLSQALEDRVSEDCLWASQLPELHMHALIFYIFLLSVNLIITPKPGRSQCSPTSAACLWQAAHSLPSLVVSHRFVHLFFKKRGDIQGEMERLLGTIFSFLPCCCSSNVISYSRTITASNQSYFCNATTLQRGKQIMIFP